MEDEPKKPITVEAILEWLRERVENRDPIPPSIWLDCAHKLVVLSQDLDEELVELESQYNSLRSNLVLSGLSVAAATVQSKASSEYRKWRELNLKKERIIEMIRIAKKRTQLADWDI